MVGFPRMHLCVLAGIRYVSWLSVMLPEQGDPSFREGPPNHRPTLEIHSEVWLRSFHPKARASGHQPHNSEIEHE